ncbi:MAG: DNA translocase FtsK 4TM domain-containing protein [Oxalobacter formigenes]|nr:DNA translocase FtsK 4TM domain-containing protein [Oxalobacter formigenes]
MSKTASVYKRTKEPADPAPAPPSRLARLLTEARWLVLIALTLFFFIVLYTYSPADPGWSHAVHVDTIRNMGGKTGAWISDLLLFTFGLSAWWCGLWLLRAVLHGYRRIASLLLLKETPKPGWFRDRLVPNLGFLILLSSSAAVEYLRMYAMKIPLPRAPGGVLGEVLGAAAMEQLGFTGATLILLVLFALGFSLFLQTSWLQLSEKVGTIVEGIAWIFIKAYRIRQDRKIGQEATQKREEILEQEKARVIETPPVQIEPQIVEVPKSDRAEKEKQVVLFSELQELPPLSLLDEAPPKQDAIPVETLEFTSRLIEKKLADFGVSVRVVTAHPGPVVTRYEIDPATGVKGSTIVNLERDLARSLSLVSLRVIETIPGKNYMALELPNPKRQIVRLTEILSSKVYSNESSTLTIALGKDIAGNPVVADLARMPHLLVAGTTGSGKSVAINATILSLLYKADPSQVRMILIDPKMLELSIYEGIPHLLSPVVTDMRQAGHALNWAVGEMERRYKLMSHVGVRNLAGYNNRIAEAKKRDEPITNPFSITPDNPEPLESLPSIVIIIDELADLMMVVGKKVEELIARIAQKARAAGIHLILATQRPSVDVITGLIKANIPTRIAFQVSSKIDSRTILDQMGAETLLGLGDMLYLPPGTGLPLRAHGAFVSDEEVQRVVNYLREHGQPDYVEGILEGDTSEDAAEAGQGGGNGEADPLYDQAVAVVLKNRRASISLVQRHLRIGYNRAARLLEQMEQSGIVSPMRSNGNREILVPIQPD